MNKIIKTSFLMLLSISMLAVAGCSKEKDDSSKTGLLALAALSSRSSSASTTTTRDMYTGFADIPSSIYKTVASGATASVQGQSRTLATTDYKFQNSDGSSSVSKIYDLVRVTAKSTRDIAKSIGDIVKVLEAIPVSATALQGTDTWGGVASKYKYQPSTILPSGKKLEVWWNNGAAPYANNKAIEMNYTGSTTAGNINGFVFVRYLSATSATTLSKAYINFNYNATTSTRSMVVILQDIGPTFTDKAHFYVQEVNGVTSMDGTYTVNNFNVNSSGSAPGVAIANRAYVFSAIGNATKAVVNAALPLVSDNSTSIYSNTAMGNIGQVWTNFIFANSSVVTAVQGLGGACAAPNVILTPTNGNPTATTATGVTTVANLKACLDTINPSVNAKDVYFLTNIKNPAYFSVSGTTVSLYGVESLDAADANKAAFDALQNNTSFLTSTRTTTNTTYAAALDAVTVSGMNLFTGVGIPTGTSATDLAKLNAQWGGSATGTGTSTSSATANTVNGSIDNTAPF